MFGIFNIIAITVGVLVVYFTSPEASNQCNFDFKRTMPSSVVSSSKPLSVALGDLNHDHVLDIVVTNSGRDTIGIFLSPFSTVSNNEINYSTGVGSYPSSVIVHDFNHDNYLDIAVANYGTNSIGIFLANQNGGFDNQKILSLDASRPVFITIGDFNLDQQMDIAVVSNSTNTLGILLGNVDGTFQRYKNFHTGYDSSPRSLAIGDFNEDKKLDIVVVNSGTNNIGLFLGHGDGTFASQKTYTTNINSNPSSVAVNDLNNDNHLDILVTNSASGNIGIFLGYGNGTFSQQTTYSLGSDTYASFIDFGNFDKDNQIDIVIVDSKNDQLYILLKYDNTTFTIKTIYDDVFNSRPNFLVVADFNNDSQSDVVLINFNTDEILLLTNYFMQPSARQKNYMVGEGSASSSIVAYDFNNDDQLDLITNNIHDDGIVIFFGHDDGTYEEPIAYSTGIGSAPKRLAIGDLNNDKKMDIISANYGSDSIAVLLGQNNGTFANATTFSLGSGSKPWPVAVGDFNHDGLLDIVVGLYGTDGFGFLQGKGNGNFSQIMKYDGISIQGPVSMFVNDINNDTHLDIAVTNCGSDDIAIVFGYGNGNFSEATSYSVRSSACPTSLIFFDVNNDNRMDIIFTVLEGGYVGVLLGYGNGTFHNMITYSIGSTVSSYSIAIADLNNDNQTDLLVSDIGTEAVLVLYAYDNGTIQLVRKYSTGLGSNPYAIMTVPAKNSSTTNIIVTLWGSGNIAVLTEYIAAQFENQMDFSTVASPKPYSVTVGDFNSDKFIDIAIVNSGLDTLDILFNSGNSTYETKGTYHMGLDSYPRYVTTGNINKDTILDLVVVNYKYHSISIMMGQNDGNFSVSMTYSTKQGSYPLAVAIADVNNDNQSDIIIANSGTNEIALLIGYNYATFQNHNNYSDENAQEPETIITSDFNNDHNLDIAVTYVNTNNLGIFLGYGNGSFSSIKIYSTGPNSKPKFSVAYDFDKDDRMDIAIVNSGTEEIFIFRGYGNGTFQAMIKYPTGNGSLPVQMVLTDLNRDNQMDMIVSNYGTDTIGILFGHGNFSFDSQITFSTGDGSHPRSIAVSDLDNDGQIDIVVSNYGANTIRIFLGYVNRNFTQQKDFSTGSQSWPIRIMINDFNGDNRLDIATCNYNTNNIGILLGQGNGSFFNVITYSTGDGSSPTMINSGDFNNDSIIDIAVVNYGANNFVILFGYGDGTFLLGTNYPTGLGSNPVGIAIGDFNKDERLDVAVTNSMLNSITIFRGYGNEIYAGIKSISTGTGSQPNSVAIKDMNNDGHLDILAANYGTNDIAILFGDGQRNFNTIIKYSLGVNSGPYDISVADLNDDNQSDIVVSNSKADNIAILFGYANGTLSSMRKYSTGSRSQPHELAIVDINKDNQLDIIVSNWGTNNILIFHGCGDGFFGNQRSYNLGYRSQPQAIAIEDLNQDTWKDFVIACQRTNHVETLIQMCT